MMDDIEMLNVCLLVADAWHEAQDDTEGRRADWLEVVRSNLDSMRDSLLHEGELNAEATVHPDDLPKRAEAANAFAAMMTGATFPTLKWVDQENHTRSTCPDCHGKGFTCEVLGDDCQATEYNIADWRHHRCDGCKGTGLVDYNAPCDVCGGTDGRHS